MTQADIKLQLHKLKIQKQAHELGLKKKDARGVPFVLFDPKLNWLCRSCPYKQECEKNG